MVPKVQLGEKQWWFFPKSGAFSADGMAYFDRDTTLAILGQLGWFVFDPLTPFFEPSLQGLTSNFLRDHLQSYLANIISALRAYDSTVVIEQLYAYDVNQDIDTQQGISGVGGKWNFFINTPSMISDHSSTDLDLLKVEALAHGVTDRDNDRARVASNIYKSFNWPPAKVSYMLPILNAGCPWQREFHIAEESQVSNITLWAGDHYFLFSWPEIPPAEKFATAR